MKNIKLFIVIICIIIGFAAHSQHREIHDSLAYRTGKIINFEFFNKMDSLLKIAHVNKRQFIQLEFYDYNDIAMHSKELTKLNENDSVTIVAHYSYGYFSYFFDKSPVTLISYKKRYYTFPGLVESSYFQKNNRIKFLPIDYNIWLESFNSIYQLVIILKEGSEFILLPDTDERYFNYTE